MHFYAITRRTSEIIRDLITLYKLDAEIIKSLLPNLYKKFKEIVAIRFKNDPCAMLMKNSKEPLWCSIVNYFIAISTYLVNPELYDYNANKSKYNTTNEIDLTKQSEDRKIVV